MVGDSAFIFHRWIKVKPGPKQQPGCLNSVHYHGLDEKRRLQIPARFRPARAGIELTLETAKDLRAALDRAIAAADFEEAEVRGKGAVPGLVAA